MDSTAKSKKSRNQKTITFQPDDFVAFQLPKAMKRLGTNNRSMVINNFLLVGISKALNGK